MVRYIVLCVFALSLFSCRGGWSNEDKDSFHKDCMESMTSKLGSADKAKTVCDCRLEKIMQKYPAFNDMMEHLDKVANDTDLAKCNELAR